MDPIHSEQQPSSSASVPSAALVTRFQGTIIIILMLAALIISTFSLIIPINHWEYQTVELPGTGISRTGSSALSASTILLDSSRLNAMGEQGWELVDSFVEVETAFPNFGKEEYVTGLRENIRPQKAVLIFKRRAKWF